MDEDNKFETVVSHLKKYIETRWDLFLLTVSDKVSDLISSAASFFLIAVSLIFFLMFVSIGAALWIMQITGNAALGFLYVAIFYLVLGIVLFIFRNSFIKMPVMNKILKSIHADENDS